MPPCGRLQCLKSITVVDWIHELHYAVEIDRIFVSIVLGCTRCSYTGFLSGIVMLQIN